MITAVARYPDVAVVARNSTFTYKGMAVDIRKAASELGASYVLEGSARKAGNRIRIAGQLIDATTGTHLWADRFDGRLDDALDLQDQLVARIIGAVEPTLRSAEIERARQKPDGALTAHDLYLRSAPHANALRAHDNSLALGYLDRALALEPDYTPALAYAAWCRVQRVRRPTWTPAGPDDFGDAVALARRAIAKGSGDAVSMAVAGFSLVTLKVDHVVDLDAVRHAVSLDPRSGLVSLMAGSAMVWCGDYDAALLHLNRVVAYGTQVPGYSVALTMVSAAELLRGQPEAALQAGQRSMTLNPGSESAYWLLAAAQVRTGRLVEARENVEKFLERAPGSTIAGLRASLPIHDTEILETVLQSLSEAGLPG